MQSQLRGHVHLLGTLKPNNRVQATAYSLRCAPASSRV
jgi:hypothetical protein